MNRSPTSDADCIGVDLERNFPYKQEGKGPVQIKFTLKSAYKWYLDTEDSKMC